MHAWREPQQTSAQGCLKRSSPPNRFRLNQHQRQQRAGANEEKGQPAMINSKTKSWAFPVIFLIAVGVCAQDHGHSTAAPHTDKTHANCPMMKLDQSSGSDHSQGHTAHSEELNARGEQAMGFSQTATTHHFLLSPD